mmetsp:Transcript_74534/g.207091  ORF Transcript_74534/g.207091 Transcript_74534/m.207091 type:complete len:506 (+) Transcript_74534:121-1638(+)
MAHRVWHQLAVLCGVATLCGYVLMAAQAFTLTRLPCTAGPLTARRLVARTEGRSSSTRSAPDGGPRGPAAVSFGSAVFATLSVPLMACLLRGSRRLATAASSARSLPESAHAPRRWRAAEPVAGRRRSWWLGRKAQAEPEAPPIWETGTLPPIWVVNLDRSPGRLGQTRAEFAKQSMDVVKWSATDGKALQSPELEEKTTWWARNFCTPGMVGCFLSHLGIWKEIVERKLPCVIVVEDDVIPYEGFRESIGVLQNELDALPGGWDVCLLGAIGCINPVRENFYMRFYELGPGGGRPCPKGSTTRTLSEHLFVPHRPAGTHAYMISYEGARKLAERYPRARYHVDLTAWSMKDLTMVSANPFLATQRFDEGAASTVAKAGSKTELLMQWIPRATGIIAIAREGGLTNVSWAWRTPIFAIPIPWRKWPGRVWQVSQGPFTSVLCLLTSIAIIRRSPIWAGLACGYLCLMSGFIRFLCGTLSWPVFLAEAGSSIIFFAIGFSSMPWRL